MPIIERAPFFQNWEKLLCPSNVKTADSVVGKITVQNKDWVIKWPRKRIYELEEGERICQPHILLPDFGPYSSWREEMEEAH